MVGKVVLSEVKVEKPATVMAMFLHFYFISTCMWTHVISFNCFVQSFSHKKTESCCFYFKIPTFNWSSKTDEQTNNFRFASGSGRVVMIDEQTGSCGWFLCGFRGCGNVGVRGHGNRLTRTATYFLFLCAGWTLLTICVRVYNNE